MINLSGKLATWFGAYYDPEKDVDVWPHYAVKNAVRRTMLFGFILLNLATYALGMGEGMNTGLLPTGLSTTRALILTAILLRVYPHTVDTFAKALDKLPMTEYVEDEKTESDESNAVLAYLDKKHGDEDAS